MRKLFRGIRSKFILIYLLLGLAPLLAMTYHASYVGSLSLENLSTQQLTNLTDKTASQINQHLSNIYKDLDLLANYPFIQLAFLQFSFGQRLETVAQKLSRYKVQNPLYARISLVSFNGDLILTVPEQSGSNVSPMADLGRLFLSKSVDTFSSGVLLSHPDGPLLVFSKRVVDFEDATRPVGHLVFYVKLATLSGYVEDLSPVPGTVGFVFDHQLNRIISSIPLPDEIHQQILEDAHGTISAHKEKIENYRLYWSRIADLDWSIGLVLPEQALLGSISRLKVSSLTFTALVAVVALLLTVYLVKRITNPIAQLMRGAQEFSAGNLDHRIRIKGEGELRRLGEKYNAMASQLKSREKQIIQVDRLASLGIMAAGIAHEVRNPLAGMKSCAQLMKRKAISSEVETLAHGINVEIDRLDQIVRQLLDFARPREAFQSAVLLTDCVSEILQMVRKELDQRGIKVITEFNVIPLVMTDARHVQQIFLNLILNAAQAMPDGGSLTIVVQQAGERVVVSISDTGCGISAEHLDRIFDPFFTTRPSGTGLGLSVVHSLMKENNITWRITSEIDKGTIFLLYFQLYEDAQGE